ncbi:PGL/p-HBAD biosynthesis glycosyltransferase [subsurface metagenome]
MKISLITATYNSSSTIAGCIASVNNQTYPNIEHIIIDGRSNDNTIEIIKSNPNRVSKIISEPDKGIYDAMNKGIKLATGDIIGILNSDDFFTSDEMIEKIVSVFKTKNIDGVYGDICFVNPENLNKVVRYYSSAWFNPSLFRFGFMPAHPSFYVLRKCYENLGLYKTNFKIASDYELLIRYLKVNKLKTQYLDFCVVTMRTGGSSTRNLKSNWILNKEIVRGCRGNGIYTNMIILSLKYFIKITGFLFPNRNKS